MKRSIKISAVMHKLLIEKRMDGFSVMEARDASLNIGDGMPNLDEARKKVYRQIWQYQQRGWLRTEGEGRNRRYFQTKQFRDLEVAPRRKTECEYSIEESGSNYSVLFRESNEYKNELEIVIGEIDEYQSLRHRFPELESRLSSLLQQAKERSANLLGKVKGLENVLKTLSDDNFPC
ncbi:hypothetical protein ACPFUL_002055 [Vibrio cholerae]|jgi:hypothetical protein|uniref:hypothetical protein n=1 Tax=Vibrio metoecus TaxID=1481663 RepID=UPI00050BE6B9|nr:hypothetical protein [Vibrio metoecus]EJL6523097.1 hypothetical protein [Vibrio cholerae]EJL6541901.1 hypothetical protein [Vibrio cholerae]HDZ9177992.1 hypothetical protein [Vibrio cholerae]